MHYHRGIYSLMAIGAMFGMQGCVDNGVWRKSNPPAKQCRALQHEENHESTR